MRPAFQLPSLVTLALLLASKGSALAQSAQPEYRLNSARLSIFSNGTFYHVQNGDVPVRNNKVILSLGDEKILKGTLWFGAEKGVKLNQVIIGQDTIKKLKTAVDQNGLLRANIGKQVTLVMNSGVNGAPKEYSGILKGFEDFSGLIKLQLPEGKGMFITQSGRLQDFYLPVNAASQYEQDTVIRSARLMLTGAGAKTTVQMVSMQQGISWLPSYLLRLDKDKTGRLQMKATIQNAATNFRNVEADLVVGTPEMAYGTELDPVSQGYTPPQPPQPQYNNYKYLRNNRMPMAAEAMGAAPMVADAASVDVPVFNNQDFAQNGERKQELYYYRTGKISLDKGEISIVNLFSQPITYSEIYEAEVPDAMPVLWSRAVQNNDTKYTAYHKVVFTNTTKTPLTAASILVMDDKEEPIAQSSMPYVPVNGETKINIAQTRDVEVKYTEEEVDRSLNLKRLVDRITVKGKVQVVNLHEKEITLKVTKHVTGDLINVGANGKAVKTGRYLQYRNAMSRAEWTLTLKPGDKAELPYEYKVFLQD